MLERGRVELVMAMTIGIVAALASGCTSKTTPPSEQPAPADPSAYFRPESIMTVSLEAIQKYVARLHFDPVPGAADQLPVDFERRRVGTERAQRIQIEPESDSYNLSEKGLASGRIIARLRSEVEVPKLGLGPRWTWWWVDHNGPRGSWRSVFIPDSAPPRSRVALPDTLVLMKPHYPWRQAIARFWVVKDASPLGDPVWVESWGTCGGCCRQRLVLLAPE